MQERMFMILAINCWSSEFAGSISITPIKNKHMYFETSNFVTMIHYQELRVRTGIQKVSNNMFKTAYQKLLR